MAAAVAASLALLRPAAHAADIVARMCLCGVGFSLYQSPNLKALMSSAPPERSAAASGVIAMVRLTGQTTGAALVALCLGLGGLAGASWALLLGVGFASLLPEAGLALAFDFGHLLPLAAWQQISTLPTISGQKQPQHDKSYAVVA